MPEHSEATESSRLDAGFLLEQKVYDAFREIETYLRREETIVAVHPCDLSDELRAMIQSAPLVTLRESEYVKRGSLYVIRPALLRDLNG